MIPLRTPAKDPRTIARDIPGVLDSLFPQLVPGVVAHFNRGAKASPTCSPVPQELVEASTLQRSMLFELSVAAAEQLIVGAGQVNWDTCLTVAVSRQRKHFDSKIPAVLLDQDKIVAQSTASNLAAMLLELRADLDNKPIAFSPEIPGYQWISSGVGDFAIATSLIEVKCTNKHFSSSDYRQMLMYWMLAYAASLERGVHEWTQGVLLNPRLNLVLKFSFKDFIHVTSSGRSKVELLEHFSSMVGDRTNLSMQSQLWI